MKNKKQVLGFQVEIRPQSEKFYTEYCGFYFTKEQAETRAKDCPLLDGEKLRIKTIFNI